MAFDRKHYNQVKKFMKHQLEHRPWCSNASLSERVTSFLPLIPSCNNRGDYEGAKATTDAIREFLNQYLSETDQIPKTATLKIPKHKPMLIQGIICFTDHAQIINELL